jgi:hypothetical protein
VASLEAQLCSLSTCSLCAQPLQSLPDLNKDIPSTTVSPLSPKNNDTNNSTDAENTLAEDGLSDIELADRFRMLSFEPLQNKFFGSASSFLLISTAIDVRAIHRDTPWLILCYRSRRNISDDRRHNM